MAGTPYGILYPLLRPAVSGFGIAAMVAGIAALLVAVVVVCLGTASGRALASGAFAVLALVLGGAALVAGVRAARAVRISNGGVRGRGMAVTGICCGAVAIGVTAFGIVLALLLSR